MARGGARVGAGRPKKEIGSNPAEVPDGVGLAMDEDPDMPPKAPDEDPLTYMLRVMNDPEVEDSRRDRIAVAAAPYMHPKVGEGGKKEQKQRAASKAGIGKFAPAAPPKLVVSNG